MQGAGPSSPFLPGDKHPGLALPPECASQTPAVAPGLKACPYSHAASPASSSAAPGSPLPTSLDFCKTLPKQFKTMCRRATPPGACPGAGLAVSSRPAAPCSPRCPSAFSLALLFPVLVGRHGAAEAPCEQGWLLAQVSCCLGGQGLSHREVACAEVVGGPEPSPGQCGTASV